MNNPAERIFSTRPTVILELPLAKNTRILHPEQIILKIGPGSHDIGAFCYSLRSSKPRKASQPAGMHSSKVARVISAPCQRIR